MKNLSRRREEYEENWLIIFFRRRKKKRRKRTLNPGGLFHNQVKADKKEKYNLPT
ncbi:MAG: hypothetical protein HOG03_23905 [Desulfobacula sp.]|uniref:hypothetical protein n=1 Tax=Desulfobacula sp. TaxID=2593537 RepID=UPI001DA9BD76|nr:hypothetical protein [Desulfobacula sp.]MBT3485414.1 hypothetical protein [Desulfobacula sp.]MBT3807608.1 hypothetical protein [Desulfobacula sp.]MBT4027642.1 hypothetical protein [Desulfobacula sp.]MBT4201040.1 hypothetical protein [Desulfobacula sp.]